MNKILPFTIRIIFLLNYKNEFILEKINSKKANPMIYLKDK